MAEHTCSSLDTHLAKSYVRHCNYLLLIFLFRKYSMISFAKMKSLILISAMWVGLGFAACKTTPTPSAPAPPKQEKQETTETRPSAPSESTESAQPGAQEKSKTSQDDRAGCDRASHPRTKGKITRKSSRRGWCDRSQTREDRPKFE